MKQLFLPIFTILAIFMVAFMSCQNEAGGSIAPNPNEAERLKDLVSSFTITEGDKTTALNEIAAAIKESTYTYTLNTLTKVSVTITFKNDVTGTYKVKGSAEEPSAITDGTAFDLGKETYNLTLQRNNETLDLILEVKTKDYSPQEKFTALVESLTITEVDDSPISLTSMTDDAKIIHPLTQTSKPVVTITLNDNVTAGEYKLSTDSKFTAIDGKEATINPDLTKQGLLALTYDFKLESDSVYENLDFTLEINKEAKTPQEILAGLTSKLTVEDNALDGDLTSDYKASYKAKKSEKPTVVIQLKPNVTGTMGETTIPPSPESYSIDVDLTDAGVFTQTFTIDLASNTIFGDLKFDLTVSRDKDIADNTNIKSLLKISWLTDATLEELEAANPLDLSEEKPMLYTLDTANSYRIYFLTLRRVNLTLTYAESSFPDTTPVASNTEFDNAYATSPEESVSFTFVPNDTNWKKVLRKSQSTTSVGASTINLYKLTITSEGGTSKTIRLVMKIK